MLLENAPITLILTIFTIFLTLIYGSSELISLGKILLLSNPTKLLLTNSINEIDIRSLYKYEVWRLFTSQCIFSNMAQTFIGMLLMYICRQFERQFGSRKYGGFVVLSFVLSVLLQFLVVTITGAADLDFTPAHGPFFLIFSLLPLFYCKQIFVSTCAVECTAM